MSRRIALLIQNQRFLDRRLMGVLTPHVDLRALAEALRDPQIGGFNELEICREISSGEIRQKVHTLFHGKRRWDLVLMFYTGLIIQDYGGQIYLASADTELSDLAGTAVSAASLTHPMDRSFSRRQVVMLDCTNILLASSSKEQAPNQRLDIRGALRGKGRWRVIITVGSQPDYLIHPEGVQGGFKKRRFTSFLTEGLQSGEADRNGDGQIGVKELFEYARDCARENGPGTEPLMWSFHRSAWLIIAGNPTKGKEDRPSIKWDLIFGAIFAPFVTVLFGRTADLVYSFLMASLFFLLYMALYQILD